MLNEEEFASLAHLAHIAYTEDEKKKFRTSLDRILTYIEQLQAIPTDGVEPCSQVLSIGNSMRNDIIGELISKKEFLENVPETIGGMVRVPSVIKFES